MRTYYFGNMYLSSIQQGIQAAHVTAELFIKYGSGLTEAAPDDEYDILCEWAEREKVMILLNAGYAANIHELVKFFDNKQNPYPWAPFYESEEALDGAITSVGIVLPEKIYNTSAFIRQLRFSERERVIEKLYEDGEIAVTLGDETITHEFNKFEADLVLKLNEFGLAS